MNWVHFLEKTEIIDSYAEEYILWKNVIFFFFFVEVIKDSDIIANYFYKKIEYFSWFYFYFTGKYRGK